MFLEVHEFEDSFSSEGEHFAKGVGGEGFGLGGALDFDEASGSGHDDVHVGLGFGVFFVAEVEELLVFDDSDADGGEGFFEEDSVDHALFDHPLHGLVGGAVGGGDAGGAGSAVGHDGVAVDGDGAFSHPFEVDDGAEGTTDEALDFHASAVWPSVGVALVSLAAGPGEHGVFGGDPSLSGSFDEGGYSVFYGGGDEHMGVAHFDEA